ncbi:MAG: lipopolysaccharide biosynthesis protein [Paracoccaceae bacterium]
MTRLAHLIQRVIRARTLWVALGNAVGAGFGFVVLILLTRTLGAEGYAALAPALAVMDMGQLLIDTLLAAGVVTVAARTLGKGDSDQADAALKTGLILRLMGGLGFAVLFWGLAPVLAPQLSATTGDATGATTLLRVAGIAGGLLAVQSALIGGMQITLAFGRVATSAMFKNLLRVLVLGAVLLMGIRAPLPIALALLGAGILALLLTTWLARPAYITRARYSRPLARDMLSINKWMMLASIAIISGRIDILLLAGFSQPEQVAWYTASMQLCIAVGVLSQALVTTTLPRAAQFETLPEMRGFLRGWLSRAPLALLPVLALPFLSPWLFPAILGQGFSGGHRVLDLLFASSMITLVVNPALVLLFPLGSARIFGIAALGQVLAKWAIAWLVIDTYGAVGLAAADIVTKLAVTALIFIALSRRLAGDGPVHPDVTPIPKAPA